MEWRGCALGHWWLLSDESYRSAGRTEECWECCLQLVRRWTSTTGPTGASYPPTDVEVIDFEIRVEDDRWLGEELDREFKRRYPTGGPPLLG